VYDSLSRPENYIINNSARFLENTACDLNEHATKSLRDAQNDVMGFINADTILVGHGLETDLRVLPIMLLGSVVHTTVLRMQGLAWNRCY
jgi:RNA exonuclease 1